MLYLFILVLLSMFWSFMMSSKYLGYKILGASLEPGQEDNQFVKEIVLDYKKKVFLIAALIFICIVGINYLLKEDSKLIAWIVSILLFMFLSYRMVEMSKEQIEKLKVEQGWALKEDIKYIDTKVLSSPSKGVIPVFYLWLIWLIWPATILIQSKMEGGRSLDFISFVGPIILMIMPITYNLMLNSTTNPISEDSKINLAYNEKIQRNNSIGYVAIFFFLQMIMLVMEQINIGASPFSSIILILGLSIGLIAISGYNYIRQAKIEKEFAPYKTIHSSTDNGKYRFGFYFNKDDKRLLVPKCNPAFGWTLNLGNPKGKIFGWGSLLLVAFIIGGVFYISSQDIEYDFTDQTLEIKAPMYNRSIDFDDIVEVKLSDEKISANRTNGYGGSEKAYGHFNVKGYGNTMFYSYHQISKRIFIKLKNHPEEWYILTGKTAKDTSDLFEKLKVYE